MELTHLQISEIISYYTSTYEGFVPLQSLIETSAKPFTHSTFISITLNE